jgi:hypothetical protein
MSDGLAAANNLSDITSVDKAWDNLGNNVTFTVSGTPYNINVTGEDIIQISGARSARPDDFRQLKGLSSPVQPRLNSASFLVASGVGLDSTRLAKTNPVSSGNYYLTQGSLSGVAVQTNGVTIGSIGGSPFAASTAVSPIYVSQLKLTADLRGSDTFGSGVLASGVKGVPVEYGDLILYVRTGPL